MSLWFIFCQLQAHATTPIGSSKELLPWTQGRADCPFVVSRGGQVVGAVYCDGGSSGALAGFTGTSPCPFNVIKGDSSVDFNVDCDQSINWNFYPNTSAFAVSPVGQVYAARSVTASLFYEDGGNLFPDAGSSSVSITTGLPGTGFPGAGIPGVLITMPQSNAPHAAWWAYDGTNWMANRPLDVTVGGVEGGVYFKNGGLWLGTKTNHDVFLGSNDGFGFLQGNASGVSFYAPITMGNRQINSLGVATAATDAAVRNQAIETKDPASGSQLPIKARGHQALIAGAGTHTFATAFSVAPECTCSTEVADAALACSATTTAITLAGTGTNVVHWNCDGNL